MRRYTIHRLLDTCTCAHISRGGADADITAQLEIVVHVCNSEKGNLIGDISLALHILPNIISPIPLQETRELTDSQRTGSMEGPDPKPADLFVSKKAIVTGVGGAIHSLLAQFEQTRSVEDKRRIGSDMTNPNMGHLVRGALCTAGWPEALQIPGSCERRYLEGDIVVLARR